MFGEQNWIVGFFSQEHTNSFPCIVEERHRKVLENIFFYFFLLSLCVFLHGPVGRGATLRKVAKGPVGRGATLRKVAKGPVGRPSATLQGFKEKLLFFS